MRLFTNLRASAAVVVLTATLLTTGCTPAQQQTATAVISKVYAYLPSVQNAADTVAATVEMLAPPDAALIQIGDTAFDALAVTLQALCKSYLANPSASVLAQIQTAINTLNSTVNTAILNATGIKDAESQKLALAALKGLLTVSSVLLAFVAPTETTAQLWELRQTHTIHLAKMRPYMDEQELARVAAVEGIDVNHSFQQAEAFGF